MMSGLAVPVWVPVAEPAEQVAAYADIAAPPVLDGAENVSVMRVSPAVALTRVGAPGLVVVVVVVVVAVVVSVLQSTRASTAPARISVAMRVRPVGTAPRSRSDMWCVVVGVVL